MKRRSFISTAAAAVASVAAPRLPAWARESTRVRGTGAPTLMVRGATVYDGTGGPGFVADVAVENDLITAIGPDLPERAALELDGGGHALTPGFVDIHSHSDLSLLVNPFAESKIRQGVTTEIAGQDGSSIGPWTDDGLERMRSRYRERYDVDVDFRDLGSFFARLERAPPSVNFASMIGAGTIRQFVIGSVDRPAEAEELKAMVKLVDQAIAAGACGLSTGLEYVPGAFATTVEIAALAAPLSGVRLPYATHMRNEDDRLLGAVEEALAVGVAAGVPVHISHLKAQGRRNWWKADAVLQVLENATASGIDVTFDRYPYVAYSTGLQSLFPVWSRDGGTEQFLGRLDDPETSARMKDYVVEKVGQLGSWDSVQITSTAQDELAWARGRTLGRLAAEREVSPYDLLVDLLKSDGGDTGMVGFGMDEENTSKILSHRLGMICSDGGARATYGPLSEGTPHPRAYGTFPRLLGYYVREQRVMPLETAIRKMTGMSAGRLRLDRRGQIRPGWHADLVVFDPDTVADTATFEAPHQYPMGIRHVIVNGALTIRDGEHTKARAGRVLRPV